MDAAGVAWFDEEIAGCSLADRNRRMPRSAQDVDVGNHTFSAGHPEGSARGCLAARELHDNPVGMEHCTETE